MKKTLLAAALLAGFAGAAQAETSVTLYGIVDVGLGYNKVKWDTQKNAAGVVTLKGDSASRFGMVNGVQNGSRWGLRGTEDLGDGLRAVFQLESGFDSSNGRSAQGGRLFGRQATLGLASDSWGQLDFGRQTNIASKYFGAIDPFGAGFGQANIGTGLSAANTVRYDNMVMYRTPSFSGFEFGVGYSFSTDDTVDGNTNGRFNAANTYVRGPKNTNFRTTDNVRALTAGLRYVNGPLNVALSYDQLHDAHNRRITDPATGRTHSQKATPRMYAIGASYDFEVVKLAAAYARTTDGWFQGTSASGIGSAVLGSNIFADNFKANSYMLGVTVPLGNGAIVSSWQLIDPKNKKLTGDDETMNVFSAGYTYNFSKRTNLYTYVTYAKDFAFIDGAKSTGAGVGLRHRF